MVWQNPLGLKYHGSQSPALVFIDSNNKRVEYSWQEYDTKSLHALATIQKAGIGPGDFVAVIALNLPESFFVMSAIIMAGAVIVPISYSLLKESGHKELKHILNECQPKLVLANECLIKYLSGSEISCTSFESILSWGKEECQRSVMTPRIIGRNERDLLIMPYTSGTTGNPKGVMLNYKNIADRVKAISEVFEVSDQERLLSYLPLGHISELVATFFGQLFKGYTVYFTEHVKEIIENRERFRKLFPHILQKVRPTIFLAVPKIWSNFKNEIQKKTRYIPVKLEEPSLLRNLVLNLIKNKLGLNHTRIFVSASAWLDPQIKDFFEEREINIKDVYGQTETAGPVIIDGKIIGDLQLFFGKDDEIILSGDCVMMGYYKDTATDTNHYHTGDEGLWENGRTYCQGRIGDSFKLSQGEFVSASKVELLESEIKKIEGVEEAIVCGNGKPYPIALIFHSQDLKNMQTRLDELVPNIGLGLYKIGRFILSDTSSLEYTLGTLKLKRKAVIKKFQEKIDAL